MAEPTDFERRPGESAQPFTFRQAPPPSQQPGGPRGTGVEPPFSPPTFEAGGGWGERSSGWLRENASSIVLPVIALLVLGAGVYFYTRGSRVPERPIVEFEGAETASTPTPGGPRATEAKGTALETPPGTPVASPRIKLSPEGQPIMGGPEAEASAEVVVAGGESKLKALQGEGITHLARRTARAYLARTNAGYTVTAEHKIYIEDFLKDAVLATRPERPLLALGEELSFSEELLKQAVEQARTLTAEQLKNLEQFSMSVANL